MGLLHFVWVSTPRDGWRRRAVPSPLGRVRSRDVVRGNRPKSRWAGMYGNRREARTTEGRATEKCTRPAGGPLPRTRIWGPWQGSAATHPPPGGADRGRGLSADRAPGTCPDLQADPSFACILGQVPVAPGTGLAALSGRRRGARRGHAPPAAGAGPIPSDKGTGHLSRMTKRQVTFSQNADQDAEVRPHCVQRGVDVVLAQRKRGCSVPT